MAKKITLFSYQSKPDKGKLEVDTDILNFLELCTGKILVIGVSSELEKIKCDCVVVDSNLRTIQEARKRYRCKFVYTDFMIMARKCKKNEFDLVLDNGYSNSLLRNELHSFYKHLSKVLKFNGTLISRVLSINDSYCREHCPKRHWTYIGDRYVNFFKKRALLSIMRKYGFVINKHIPKQGYHVVNSTYRMMKL